MATSKKTGKDIIKTKPTIFPMGFAIGQVENGMVIIDFIDVFNGQSTIIESIALPQNKAAQLSASLMEIIENGESQD